MPPVDVSVVIVSYQTRDLLSCCLASLPAAAGNASWEAIVVDNGSRDGSPEMVRERFPRVRLFVAGDNPGFARSTNLGLDQATGRTWVWLNPDCEMEPGSLAALVRYLDEHPEVGAVGPKLVSGDGTPQPSAQAFPSGARMLYHVLGVRRLAALPWARRALRAVVPRSMKMTRSYLEALDPGSEPRRVDWITGACLATPAHVARRVGPLDESYFMYCEDTDWCHRVHDSGLEVHLLPGVQVIHRSGSSGPSNPLTAYHHYASLMRYFRRYRPREFPLVRAFMMVTFAVRGIAGDVRRWAGRGGEHAWWRLARLCWSPGRALDRRA